MQKFLFLLLSLVLLGPLGIDLYLPTIPAIAVMNKTAMLFLLNRLTGEPLYEVKEVPVPTDTDIPDEKPWPTQPMPVAPPPLARLEFKMSDLANLTPEHRAACQLRVTRR